MFDGIKRLFTNPQGQANALKVNGDINAPVNLINLILENGAQITVPLDIKWSATQLQADAAPSQLLHWRTRLTDLLGRDEELAALKAWAQGSADSSQAQVIVGDGGVGKTRLAMELADWLRVNHHWRAGALNLRGVSSFRALGGNAGNTLIVVDYPEANPDAVKRLLCAVLESEENKSIKLLFLTRERESMSAVMRDAGAQDLFAPTPLMLLPFADAAYALFCAAFKAVTTQSNALPPNRATFATWQSCSPLHAAALFLVAAGISAARYPNVSGASEAIPIGVELLVRMCEDETRKLQDIARGVNANPDAAVDVLAIATLMGDINFDTLVARPEASACGIEDAPFIRNALLASGHATQGDTPSILTVARLEPDLFAAAFTQQWHFDRWKKGAKTQARLSNLVAQCFATSETGTRVASLNQWNRLAFDVAVRLGQLPNRFDGWLCQLLQEHAVLNRALTHTWSASPLWVGLPKSASANRCAIVDCINDAERAFMLNNLAIDLANSEDRANALVVAGEAVDIRRNLAALDPAVYAPNLASSLHNLANRQSESGDRDNALATAIEAVDLYRNLDAAKPSAYAAQLAACLNNLARCQSDNGNRESALLTGQKATELYRKLAVANPAFFAPDLAMSLNNLANRKSETGDRASALATAREATDLYRVLAVAEPATHTPNLAMGLSNLASCQSETGDREGALVTAREAVGLRRKLAASNPEGHAPHLVRSMCVLATMLAAAGDSPEAAEVAREAVNLLEPFAAKSPAAFGGLLQTATRLRDQLLG